MGLSTQSSFPEQSYSMSCVNSTSPLGNGHLRQLCPLPAVFNAPLTSQKSVYSLILDEFKNTVGEPGKSFGSMNMEELLKNKWTAEEGQAMAAAMGIVDGTGLSNQKSLQKQGSLFMRGPLSQKTVDEIWKSIYQGRDYPADSLQVSAKQKEFTFGEVTLEDFLEKAGIVLEEDFDGNIKADGLLSSGGDPEMHRYGAKIRGTDESAPNRTMHSSPTSVLVGDNMKSKTASQMNSSQVSLPSADFSINRHENGGNLQQSRILQYPPSMGARDTFGHILGTKAADAGQTVSSMDLGGLHPPVGGRIAASLNANHSFVGLGNPLSVVPAPEVESPLSSNGTGTSQGSVPLSPVYHSEMSIPLKKRSADEHLETAVERRQRRMIKNRESAARSRSRKQAYTVELENEVNELRAENAKLMLKQENADKQLKKILAITQEASKHPRVLLRSRTGPW